MTSEFLIGAHQSVAVQVELLDLIVRPWYRGGSFRLRLGAVRNFLRKRSTIRKLIIFFRKPTLGHLYSSYFTGVRLSLTPPDPLYFQCGAWVSSPGPHSSAFPACLSFRALVVLHLPPLLRPRPAGAGLSSRTRSQKFVTPALPLPVCADLSGG